MTQPATKTESPREIRDLLGGRPGGVNRVIKRFGKPVVDYVTALIPDRSETFDRVVEDILVDVLSQARAAARAQSDEEVFEFVIESALRTIRARYREILEADAKPTKATTSYSFKEVIERTRMSETELTEGISSGRITAVREDDKMKVKPAGIPGLPERKAHYAFHVTAAERELLCLHFRLGFSPETIARWSGSTSGQIEDMIDKAAGNLARGMQKKGGEPDRQDTEIRRYIDGRLDHDETSKFERSIIKDKIAQRRLDDLRMQSEGIRELFDSDYYDLSSVAVNVRTRNPHHSLALPPVAALWLQVVGLAAILLMFHSVGGYVAPPEVKVIPLVGEGDLPPESWLGVSESVETGNGAQTLMVLDDTNRVLMAPGSDVKLLEPRAEARQVLGLNKGELWGRFASTGHAFLVEFPIDPFDSNSTSVDNKAFGEITSDAGAEFDLVSGVDLNGLLPDSLEQERVRAVVRAFKSTEEGLLAKQGLKTFANFRFGTTGEDDPGILKDDRLQSINDITIRNSEDLAAALRALAIGEKLQLTVQRNGERVGLPVERIDVAPGAVVRVFHGALMAGSGRSKPALVNKGQWALFFAGQPPLVGKRGPEDFRLLRIDSNDRFKDRLHWLNTETYPLRAENNLLTVERALRALAEKLETIRAENIQRDGSREISNFESIMRKAISDAKDRITAGNEREDDDGLSDQALVASEDEIIGLIQHWRRQSTSGVFPTLGDAAKTLRKPVLHFEDDLKVRDEELTRSILLQKEIEDKEAAILVQENEIDELKKSDFYDADGSKVAAIDAQISELEKLARDGQDAAGRKELIMVKLNALDEKIDNQRRKIAGLKKAVTDAERALTEVNSQLKANIYTAAKIANAEQAVESAKEALATARLALQTSESEVAAAKSALKAANKEHEVAKKALTPLVHARDTAQDALTDALAARNTAQTKLDETNAEVERIQGELDAMAEDDPNRAAKQTELESATKAAEEAQASLDTAAKTSDDANTALDTASKALTDAEAEVATKKTASDKASTDLDAAEDARNAAAADVKAAEGAERDARATLKDLQDAKAARTILDTHKIEVEGELSTAQSNLADVEAKITELDAQAEPHRQKMNTELAIIEEGEEAEKSIGKIRKEVGRYKAISEDIDRHEKDRKALVEDRDRLANASLVKNYDKLLEEYKALQRRIEAYKFVTERGIIEDQNFALEQAAAQDLFRDAAEQATNEAVRVLDQFCPVYDDATYAKTFKDDEGGPELRMALLEALWKLYYDAGISGGSDDNDIICYYVVLQSGADAEALGRLDNRWQAYLTEALGRAGFETIANLAPEMIQPPTADKGAENAKENE